ncbi:MAG: hypothetical protein ABW128_16890 [Rhizorhabdus sp.]
MTDTPDTTPYEGEFKVAEVREDGVVVVVMDDGRMFTLPDYAGERPRKGSKIDIIADGVDEDGTLINPSAKAT